LSFEARLSSETHRREIGEEPPSWIPTELDALVFGHLYTLLTTVLPGGHFTSVLRDFDNLCKFCKRIEDLYFRLGGFD